jgi:hypothetical protein
MNFGRMEKMLFNVATDGTESTGGGFDFEALREKADELENEEINEEPEEEVPPAEEPAEEIVPPTEEPEEEIVPPVEPEEEIVPPVEGEEPPAEPYTPDLSYKALDQEHKMPEWLKDTITSKEREDEIREIFQKAEGLSHVKSKNEHLKSELETIRPAYEEQSATLNYLDHLVNTKDLENIQKMARLSDDDILNHAAKILEKQGLTPEQQAAYNSEIENRNSQYFMSQENATLRQNQYSQQVQSQELQLEQALNSDDVKKYVDFYNERVGDQTNFKKSVIDYAADIEKRTNGKTSLSVQEAIDGFLQKNVKPFYVEPTKQMEAPAEQATPANPTETVLPPVDPREKQVMPNVQGGASKSPAKPVFKSIADIVAHREKYFETE